RAPGSRSGQPSFSPIARRWRWRVADWTNERTGVLANPADCANLPQPVRRYCLPTTPPRGLRLVYVYPRLQTLAAPADRPGLFLARSTSQRRNAGLPLSRERVAWSYAGQVVGLILLVAGAGIEPATYGL